MEERGGIKIQFKFFVCYEVIFVNNCMLLSYFCQ